MTEEPRGINGAESKQGQVDGQMDRAGERCECLENVVVELTKRLEPILRGADPGNEEENLKGEVKQQLVPLASHIESLNDRLQCVTDRLADLYERVEL